MSKSHSQTTDNIDNQCVVPVIVTTPIFNGIIGGISSVITAYFFNPLWEKVIKIFSKEKDGSDEK